MSELRERLKEEFKDREYRVAYAEDFLNTRIATQLRVLRDKREMTQAQLGQLVGTPQAGISRIENVNYSSWNITTLQKAAKALDVRLKVSFETFGSLLDECEEFSREWLERPTFEEDPEFEEEEVEELEKVAITPATSSGNVITFRLRDSVGLTSQTETLEVGQESLRDEVSAVSNGTGSEQQLLAADGTH